MLQVLLLLASGADADRVSACIDEVTVRATPSVKAPRISVVRRAEALPLLETSAELDELTLTIDRNVPAPLTATLRDVWLKVALPADAGAPTGWVFGGVMCRPTWPQGERWLTVIGWSGDGAKVAFIERATDSFACGWGRPATFRLFDLAKGRELEALHDGCPAADLMLSRRAELETLLGKHAVTPHWRLEATTRTLEATWSKGTLRLTEGKTLRASRPEKLDPAGLDAPSGFPTAQVLLVARLGDADVAFVRLQLSEDHHRLTAVRLTAP